MITTVAIDQITTRAAEDFEDKSSLGTVEKLSNEDTDQIVPDGQGHSFVIVSYDNGGLRRRENMETPSLGRKLGVNSLPRFLMGQGLSAQPLRYLIFRINHE